MSDDKAKKEKGLSMGGVPLDDVLKAMLKTPPPANDKPAKKKTAKKCSK